MPGELSWLVAELLSRTHAESRLSFSGTLISTCCKTVRMQAMDMELCLREGLLDERVARRAGAFSARPETPQRLPSNRLPKGRVEQIGVEAGIGILFSRMAARSWERSSQGKSSQHE